MCFHEDFYGSVALCDVSIVDFNARRLDEAARLVSLGYAQQRRHASAAVDVFAQPEFYRERLQSLAENGGAAALCDGRLAGFMLAMDLADFRGRKAKYAPEWAHAAIGPNRGGVYRALYERLAPRWRQEAVQTHLLTTWAHDEQTRSAWLLSEFAPLALDLIRSTDAPPTSAADVVVRRADLSDLDVFHQLNEDLAQYLAGPPIHLVGSNGHDRDWSAARLADDALATWLAFDGADAVGFITIGEGNPSAAFVTNTPLIAGVRGAFVQPECRNAGVGTALLVHALHWAQARGCSACAVSCEPQNPSGAPFWLKHFQPICLSLVRHVMQGAEAD